MITDILKPKSKEEIIESIEKNSVTFLKYIKTIKSVKSNLILKECCAILNEKEENLLVVFVPNQIFSILVQNGTIANGKLYRRYPIGHIRDIEIFKYLLHIFFSLNRNKRNKNVQIGSFLLISKDKLIKQIFKCK